MHDAVIAFPADHAEVDRTLGRRRLGTIALPCRRPERSILGVDDLQRLPAGVPDLSAPEVGRSHARRVQRKGFQQILEPFITWVVVQQHAFQSAHRIGRFVTIEDPMRGCQEAVVVHPNNVLESDARSTLVGM